MNLYLCAKESSSIEMLCSAIFEMLHAERVTKTFLIPYDQGRLVSFLMEKTVVLSTEYTEEGTRITAECDQTIADRIEKILL